MALPAGVSFGKSPAAAKTVPLWLFASVATLAAWGWWLVIRRPRQLPPPHYGEPPPRWVNGQPPPATLAGNRRAHPPFGRRQ